jgi:hypothetical protein
MNQQRPVWDHEVSVGVLIRLGLKVSVVFRLPKTATKPAEFRGPNTTTLLYCTEACIKSICRR